MNDTYQYHSLNICFYFSSRNSFLEIFNIENVQKYMLKLEMNKSSMHYDPKKKCQVLQCLNEY